MSGRISQLLASSKRPLDPHVPGVKGMCAEEGCVCVVAPCVSMHAGSVQGDLECYIHSEVLYMTRVECEVRVLCSISFVFKMMGAVLTA